MPIPPLHQFPDKSDFYVRSTPKSPLDPSAVAFSKPIPAIVQSAKTNAYYIGRLKQHLEDFNKDLAEWKESGEWKKEYKSWGAACEVALGMTRQWADRLIKRYNESTTEKVETTVSAEADAEKAETLAKLSVRPDPNSPDFNPMADIEARMPEHIKGKGASPELEPSNLKPITHSKMLENGESTDDYKRHRQPPTDNGKPKFLHPIWKQLEECVGRSLNRTDEANRVWPDSKEHKAVVDLLHETGDRIDRWHQKSKGQ